MENRIQNMIPLSSLIEVGKKVTSGEWDEKLLREYFTTLTVRSYVPLLDKSRLLILVLTSYEYSNMDTEEILTAELYKSLFFNVLLGAYGLIDCSDISLQTYENYDLLYPIFAKEFLKNCKEDYDIFLELMHESLNMYNIRKLVDTIAIINPEEINKAAASNKELFDALQKNKEIIGSLRDVMLANDSTVKAVVEEVKKVI